jgi:hypothetical protein
LLHGLQKKLYIVKKLKAQTARTSAHEADTRVEIFGAFAFTNAPQSWIERNRSDFSSRLPLFHQFQFGSLLIYLQKINFPVLL